MRFRDFLMVLYDGFLFGGGLTLVLSGRNLGLISLLCGWICASIDYHRLVRPYSIEESRDA